MSNRPATFRQADLTRVIKGATAAGVPIERVRVEIDREGKMVLTVNEPREDDKGNPWDEVLGE